MTSGVALERRALLTDVNPQTLPSWGTTYSSSPEPVEPGRVRQHVQTDDAIAA